MAKTRSGTPGPTKGAARRGAPVSFRVPPFRRSLPMLLLWARESVMKRFRASLRALGFTEQQWRVMRALAEVESQEIVALSAACCIHPASLSRILPKLSADGIVARTSNAADQRCVIVSLTPQGRRVLENAASNSERIYQQLARDVGPERLDDVYRMLEDLVQRLAEDKPARRKAAKRPRRAG